MDINDLSTNSDAEVDGVWIYIDEKTQLKVARDNNPKYLKALERVIKPFKYQIDRGLLSGMALNEKLLPDLVAKYILKDWSGMTEEGKEVKYSEAKAKEYLTKNHNFLELVQDISKDIGNYIVVEAEEAVKN